jgi:glycosyltransferase involved in cell wall biosynthesis
VTNVCKISVIMPCFNHGEFVREAVCSVQAIGRGDVELIVVDDGSTDARTAEEMVKLAGEGIQVIRRANRGLAAARNAGIEAARGEYIFPLDADDRMRADWIDKAIRILDSEVTVGVVYGDAQCFGTRVDRWRVGAFDAERLLDANYIHASALYRKVIWKQNGGYDAMMPVQGMEDWDFWLSAIERGWQFAYVPEIFFDYRQAASSMISYAKRHAEAIDEFVAKKHGPMYRNAWMRLARERQSATRTARRLGTLLKVRAGQGLNKSARMSWVPD